MSETKKTRDENLDDIVFAHRNKEYGAYELRKRYKKSVIKSLGFAFFLLLLTTVTPLIMAFNSKIGNNIVNEIITANLLKIDNPAEVPPPPPPPPPEDIVKEEQRTRYIQPVIVDTTVTDTDLPPADDITDKNKNDDLPDDPADTKDKVIDDGEIVNFYVIEEKPEFPGGEKAMMEWIAANVKYPEIAKESGVTGKVFIQFVINKEGKVVDVEVLRGVDAYLDKEAIRVITDMPSWTPGKQRGKAVKVSFQLPIKFMLY